MRFKSRTTSFLVSILLVMFLLSFIPRIPKPEAEQTRPENISRFETFAGTPHGPIVISGDGELKSTAEGESWPGDGTESSPYIIEDFDFDLGGTGGRCIDIQDTTLPFIIQNCYFTGASASGGHGIYLYNVTNCEVLNNTLYDNFNGIRFDGENGTIVRNEITVLNSMGICIYFPQAMNSLISENEIHGGYAGLALQFSDHCEVRNNTISDAPEVSIYLETCDNITIADNELINGTLWGIYMDYTDTCTIIRNTISLCNDGISLINSNENLIKECTLTNNTYGILFEVGGTTNENVVEFCEFRDNTERGIVVESAQKNLFMWNVFANNPLSAVLCNSPLNIFDYNYYDTYSGPDVDGDKIGDFPFLIPGSYETDDLHPLLLHPAYPEWESSPNNQNIEFGDDFSYDLDVTPTIPIAEWQVSETIRFVIDEVGTIRDIDTLDVGTYPIDVVATNTYGLSLEGSFTVTVEDSVDPIWISQTQDKSYTFGDEIEIQLMAWDLAGIESWDVNDTVNFSFGSTAFEETGILTITGIEDLPVGTYPLTITAYDPSGNSIAATLTVTVTSPPVTTTTTTTTATTTTTTTTTGPTSPTTGPTPGIEFYVSTAGLGVAVLALIVGIYAVLSSRKGS